MKFLKPIISEVPVGTAPLQIESTTAVTNLNADLLDGMHASDIVGIMQDTIGPDGFLDWTATLSFVDATRTFTITGEHNFYSNAVKYTKTTTSIEITEDVGLHYIYYNNEGVLSKTIESPGFNVPLVAFIYWNGSKGLVSDERHGTSMSHRTHSYLHYTVGVRFDNGFSATFADTTFNIGIGTIWDEDLSFTLSGAQTTCDVLFKNGSAVWDWNTNQTKYYHDNTTNLYYNSGNDLVALNSNQHVAYWIFATNSITRPIISLMGQRVDTTLANARLNNKYESLVLGDLPNQEMKLLYRVILKGDMTYEEIQDLRTVSNLPSGTYVATDHNSLTNIQGDGTYHISAAQLTVVQNTSGTNSGDETTATIGTLVNGADGKTTPIDADMLALVDTEETNVIKKVTWANHKATLKTYFDNIYNNYAHPTGDGNLHVPANGTENDGNVLTATQTAGSYTWETPVSAQIIRW